MGELHALPDRRSAHFVDETTRTGMRVTWHFDSAFFVVSLWHGNECVGTAKLEPKEAARLVHHVTEGLAALATTPPGGKAADAGAPQPRWKDWLRRLARSRRKR